MGTVSEYQNGADSKTTIGDWKKFMIKHDHYNGLQPSQLCILDDSETHEFPDDITVAKALELNYEYNPHRNKVFGGYGYFYVLPRYCCN